MKKKVNLEIRSLLNFGQVGAGKVVQFTPKEERIPVALPEHYPDDDSIVTVNVCGPSLTDLGIYDGDVLIVNLRFPKKAITINSVCILFIISTGELVAKRTRNSPNGVTLLSSGGGAGNKFYEHDAIEVRGVVIGYQKMFPDGQCPKPKMPELPF